VIDADSKLSGTGKKYRQEDLVKRVYTQAEMESGVVLNAAVILKDGSPGSIRQAVVDIDALSAQQNLGIKAVSWQQAAGFLGQFITIARGAMYFFVFMIFVIAMLIIFIAMMMATLQRTQMIGTLRAIGAQRGFVLAMVMVETLTLGVIFGALGMATGAGLIAALGVKGIGAPNDIAQFFFSGPRLLPTMAASNLIAALVLILLVSLMSTLLPAIIATRVSPLRAMQADE
jgi:ABC-type lipoprotein release transport system permease subunit